MQKLEKHISSKPDSALVYLIKAVQSLGIAFSLAKSEIKGKKARMRLGYMLSLVQILIGTSLYWLIFGIIIKVDTNGVFYPLFLLPGIISWQYFSNLVGDAGVSIETNQWIINKIYFPRVLFPLSKIIPGLVDMLIAFVILLIGVIVLKYPIGIQILLVPAFILIIILSGFSIGAWIASISIKYKDFSRLIPHLMNFGFFLTPIFYPATIIPENLSFILYINPIAFAVEGLRYSFLGTNIPDIKYLFSLIPIFIFLVWGWSNIRKKEKFYADNI
ncbi:MAG: ABC transporter permease [Bacteroidales bacterium]|nr:ABC transporter permease [Bacteroidales bacterium]